MIHWWGELTWQARGVVAALLGVSVNLAYNIFNSVTAARDRKWNRGADIRSEQRELRSKLRDELARIEGHLAVYSAGMPDDTADEFDSYGSWVLPAPPADFFALEQSLLTTADRVADQYLARQLRSDLKQIASFLECWRTTFDHQEKHLANPAAAGSASDAQLLTLRKLTEGMDEIKYRFDDARRCAPMAREWLNGVELNPSYARDRSRRETYVRRYHLH
ncbi:hypothetical protein [Nocardia sp. NPDC059239]|uniref:hypothetical protein n=1 Tax=Nocardia sp. NPDC059239 TaxID=3346785 RepID=UPI00368F9B36